MSLKQPSGPRLSEVARHVVMPEGIATTAFPPVQARAQKMGVTFDTWQQGLGTLILGKRADGLYAAGVGGVVISIPRQVGKTFTIGAIIFALCTLFPGLTVIWTAHHARTHAETFRSMAAMAERRQIAPYVEGVRRANGQEEIAFTNGSRILFGAREHGFGRGFATVDMLVLDEAQILTEKAMENMVPATNAAPNGLVLMMGTPPRPTDPGEVFTNRREAALHGEDPDILYVEFSADEKADPDDRDQWRKANPSFPNRVTESAILRMRKLLGSVDSFRREGLGIWDKVSTTARAFKPAAWDALAVAPEDAPVEGRRAFGVKFSVDGSVVGLAAAMRPAEGPIHVEGIRYASMSEGTRWLVDWLVDRKDRAAQIVIDGKSNAGYLVNALLKEGVSKTAVLTPGTDQVVAAHAMFLEAVRAGGMSHLGQELMDEQVKDAVRRPIGKAGGFGWDPGTEGADVTLLDAATLAFWGAATTKRRPGRKAVIL
ncbi:DEAD/DEAH box helicase family protein [Nesterenkonia sp.]|uniref:DEAD/DEAH box helicase family protein n=1 Tax=Nesterenkonia sp. TaxID=704201 RepID=UPI002639413D|nr:DEAD/DEAH box helicase family protein [Nesterenkonia sp.]